MHPIKATSHPRLSSCARLQWDPVREKHMLLSPEAILALNPTGAAILNLCDGNRSVSDITAELSKEYQRDVGQDVLIFLNRLITKGLMQIDEVTDQ